jgi:hypothetical protein
MLPVYFFRQYLEDLGADVSIVNSDWTLKDIAKHFQRYAKKLENYLTNNCSVEECYLMVIYFNSNKEWVKLNVEKLSKNNKLDYQDIEYVFIIADRFDIGNEWAEGILKSMLDYKNKSEQVSSAFILEAIEKYNLSFEYAKTLAENSKYDFTIVYNLYRKNSELKEWAENIISKISSAELAYLTVKDCGSDRKWAERIINRNDDVMWVNDSVDGKDKFVNFGFHYAAFMVRDCGSDREWAEKLLEEKDNCSFGVFTMVKEGGSSREWAENIFEKKGDSYYAYKMFKECGSNREWTEKVIEKAGDSLHACEMVKEHGSSREWAEGIIEKAMDGQSAIRMVEADLSDVSWAKKVIENSMDAFSAYKLFVRSILNKDNSDADWVFDVAKRSKTPGVIYYLASNKACDLGKAERAIEEIGNCLFVYNMVRSCGSNVEWGKKVIENHEDADMAIQMVLECGCDREWAEKIIDKNENSEVLHQRLRNSFKRAKSCQ